MSDDKHDLVIALLSESKEAHKENKNDLKHLRDSANGIRHEMVNISGQIQLLSQVAKTDKEESDKSFQRIHNRVDIESQNIKDLTAVVNEVAPKVNRITTVFDWAVKGFVTALVAGLLYAMSLMVSK